MQPDVEAYIEALEDEVIRLAAVIDRLASHGYRRAGNAYAARPAVDTTKRRVEPLDISTEQSPHD